MTTLRYRRFPVHLGLLLLATLAAAASAAQTVEVTSGDEKVVVEGNKVRIEGPAGTTLVDADWRRTGQVRVTTDTEQVLVELGAVTIDDRIQLNLPGDVLFDFDSDAIRPDAAVTLGKVAQVIRSKSVGEVYVLGHTDSIGDAAYNEALSRQRAASVMSWLHANEGIPAAVMVGVGMGSRRPVAHNTHPDGSDDPQGRARNRRVEFQIATSEGVEVGPDVIIAPGGVRITGSDVSVAGGTVQVDPSGVRVGGVEVTSGGVKIGGEDVVTIAGDGGVTVRDTGVDSASSCAMGEECDLGCVMGDCQLVCETGAECDITCVGGDCLVRCEPGSECDATCSGGDCRMVCESGAECDFGCSGGDCTFQCAVGSDCDRSCTGEGCTCTGMGC